MFPAGFLDEGMYRSLINYMLIQGDSRCRSTALRSVKIELDKDLRFDMWSRWAVFMFMCAGALEGVVKPGYIEDATRPYLDARDAYVRLAADPYAVLIYEGLHTSWLEGSLTDLVTVCLDSARSSFEPSQPAAV
jgi:hypothetical protein